MCVNNAQIRALSPTSTTLSQSVNLSRLKHIWTPEIRTQIHVDYTPFAPPTSLQNACYRKLKPEPPQSAANRHPMRETFTLGNAVTRR